MIRFPMLKCLLIFAVILVIMQAFIPTPGRASTPTGNGSGESENRSQDKHDPSTPAPALVGKPIQPSPPNPNSNPVAAENTEHSVKLSSLPPVTVTLTDRAKTCWDYVFNWGPWIFALGLVAIGVFQTRLLIRQEKILHGARKEIHTQARHMSRQADLLGRNNVITLATARAAEESAKAANAQIQMLKNQERARIAVKIFPIETLDLEPDGKNSVKMEIENLGPSHAHNVRSSATARVVVKGFDRWDIDDRDDLMLPKVIRADAPPIKTFLPFIFLDEWLEEILEWKFKLIIELRGVIAYEDVFGDEHRTKFSYDLTVDKANPLLQGEVLWGVKSYFGWRATHGEDDNKAD